MKAQLRCVCAAFISSALLCACQAMLPNHVNSPYCNQLNSQIVFSGATTNMHQAQIENAGQQLQQRSYDYNCTKN